MLVVGGTNTPVSLAINIKSLEAEILTNLDQLLLPLGLKQV